MKLTSVRWVVAASVLATSGLVGLLAQGCTVTSGNGLDGGGFDGFSPDTGTPDSNLPDTTPPPDSGTDSPAVDPCETCLYNQCNAQQSVCYGDPNCLAIAQCTTTTGSTLDTCECANPSGAVKYVALASCVVESECGTCNSMCQNMTPPPSCPTPDPGLSACVTDAGMMASPDASVTDCNGCVDQMCMSQKAACAAGSDCEAYSNCVNACTDAACATACGTSHPQGQMAAGALAQCTITSCAAQCQ